MQECEVQIYSMVLAKDVRIEKDPYASADLIENNWRFRYDDSE